MKICIESKGRQQEVMEMLIGFGYTNFSFVVTSEHKFIFVYLKTKTLKWSGVWDERHYNEYTLHTSKELLDGKLSSYFI